MHGHTREEATRLYYLRLRRALEDAADRWIARGYLIFAATLLVWSATHGGM